jgi:hypothetical protein
MGLQFRFSNSKSLKKSWRRDLNPRPADYKSAALPAELRQPERVILTKQAILRNVELGKCRRVYTEYGIRVS